MPALSSPLPRRALFGGALALGLCGAASARGKDVPAVAALDWVSGQNLLALGLAPAAMPELERYASLVVEPAVPPGVHELGLRSEPNLELLDRLRPDLVVMTVGLAPPEERFRAVAPVLSFAPDGFGAPDHLAAAGAALGMLADRLGLRDAHAAFVRSLDEEFGRAARRLGGYDGRPLFVATVIDGRRMLVFGRDSLFQRVLDRFGIENAWTGHTSRYGHTTVSVDRLASRPDARLLCVGDTSRESIRSLLDAPVVASLPFVRERRIALVPDVLFYGGLPPARRFARLASLALGAEDYP